MSDIMVFMFQICHGGISVGTALRAFGLSGDQTFVIGLQFRSGNPFIFLITNSLGWISLPPLLSRISFATKKEEDHNPA